MVVTQGVCVLHVTLWLRAVALHLNPIEVHPFTEARVQPFSV